MIDIELAQALQRAGLRWEPAPGDCFILPGKEMDDDVFVLSDMTIEVHEYPSGKIIGFNGTTEWALDSIEHTQALWVPREDQLRSALGAMFTSLERVVDNDGEASYVLTLQSALGRRTVSAPEPASAYGLALLDVLVEARAEQP